MIINDHINNQVTISLLFLLIYHTVDFITGDTFHISDIVMGIGILAAGGSIPEATSGIINARNGNVLIEDKLYT